MFVCVWLHVYIFMYNQLNGGASDRLLFIWLQFVLFSHTHELICDLHTHTNTYTCNHAIKNSSEFHLPQRELWLGAHIRVILEFY